MSVNRNVTSPLGGCARTVTTPPPPFGSSLMLSYHGRAHASHQRVQSGRRPVVHTIKPLRPQGPSVRSLLATKMTVPATRHLWLHVTNQTVTPSDHAPQPQAPPQQPPPPATAPSPAEARPPSATVESSFTVSSCPCGQSAGSPAARMGRSTSKVSPQVRQRNS